jgi:alkylation response protein AidB-like acyl-CoA dehydrogenase
MDLTLSEATEKYRAQVVAFLTENLPQDWRGEGALTPAERDDFMPKWRQLLLDNGYLGLNWPKEYGGAGLGPAELHVVQEEFARVGVPTLPLPSDLFGFLLIGPTLIHRGTPEQKERFVPKILSGEYRFAQGFSEPEAGSDLFGLRTKGVVDGDEWVINGQKVWQTSGDAANWIFVLTRTEPDAPKAKGLSMLLVPIEQPGVLVRPIRTMTGEEEFCEVLFDDARTSVDNIVGARGEGASVTMTLLGFERGAGDGGKYIEHRDELHRLTELVKRYGRQDDPQIRQRLAWCHSKVEILRLLTLRALTTALAGDPPGARSSILKTFISDYESRLTELAMDVLGPAGLLRTGEPGVSNLGPDLLGAPNSVNAWQNVYMTARAATIYGGSGQIQRNTMAERLLGLPPEPKVEPAKASR